MFKVLEGVWLSWRASRSYSAMVGYKDEQVLFHRDAHTALFPPSGLTVYCRGRTVKMHHTFAPDPVIAT